MENVISHKVDEMTPKQTTVLEKISRLVEIATEETALMPCSLLETYSSIILPGINMGLLLTENNYENFEEKNDQSGQKEADFGVQTHREKQEISKEKMHQAIKCKDSCIKPRSATDYFNEQLFGSKGKRCKNTLSKQEPHHDTKSNISRKKKSKLQKSIHEDPGDVEPINEEPHIYYVDQVPVHYKISAEESFVESSDEFSNIPSDDSVSSDDESNEYLGTENSYYENQNGDGGDNDSDGIRDEGNSIVSGSSNDFNNIPSDDEETDNAAKANLKATARVKSKIRYTYNDENQRHSLKEHFLLYCNIQHLNSCNFICTYLSTLMNECNELNIQSGDMQPSYKLNKSNNKDHKQWKFTSKSFMLEYCPEDNLTTCTLICHYINTLAMRCSKWYIDHVPKKKTKNLIFYLSNDNFFNVTKETIYQGRVKNKGHTDKQRSHNIKYSYHSDSTEKKYSSEKTCKHICRYISLNTSGYGISDFQRFNVNIDSMCLLEEEITSEHVVHRGFEDLDDNNKSKNVNKDRIPQKNISYAAHKRRPNTDDKDMESTDMVSSLKPQMGERSSNISLSTNGHETANHVHNMDHDERDKDRTKPNQRRSPQSIELRYNVKGSDTSSQGLADNNHYDKSEPEMLHHDKKVNYVNGNLIETPQPPDLITRLLESKEKEHNAKFQNLELMIVKLENKLLKKSLEEKDNSHVMQNLENHVLKIENELVKLNQTYQQLQHEHEVLKSKQKNLMFPMQVKTTPRRSNYLALDAENSNELMTQQKQKIEKLSQLVHDQSQDFLVLKSKYQQMEEENKQLFQIVMNQTALISNVMMQINEMKENNIKERMKNQKLNLKTQAQQEDEKKNLHLPQSHSHHSVKMHFENSKVTVSDPPDLLTRLLHILKPQTFLKSIMEIVKLQTRMNIPCPSICLYHKVIVSSVTPFSFLQWRGCKTMSGTLAYKPRTSVDSFAKRSIINNSYLDSISHTTANVDASFKAITGEESATESDNLHRKSEYYRVKILSGDIHNFKETNRDIRSDDLNSHSNTVTHTEGEDESVRKEDNFKTTGNDKNSDNMQTIQEREVETLERSRNDDNIFFLVDEEEEDNEDRPWAVKETNYIYDSGVELGMESENNNDEDKENDNNENIESDKDENKENDDETKENNDKDKESDDDEDKENDDEDKENEEDKGNENDDDEDKENEEDEVNENNDDEDKENEEDEGNENGDDEDEEKDDDEDKENYGNQNERDFIHEEDVNEGDKDKETNKNDLIDNEQDQERGDSARTHDVERYVEKTEINSNKMDMEGDGEFIEGRSNESDDTGESNYGKIDKENEQEGELTGNDSVKKEVKGEDYVVSVESSDDTDDRKNEKEKKLTGNDDVRNEIKSVINYEGNTLLTEEGKDRDGDDTLYQKIEKNTLKIGKDNRNHGKSADDSHKDGAKEANVTNHDVQLSEPDSKQDVETTKKRAVNEKESHMRSQSHEEANLVKDTKKAKLEAKRRKEALQRPLLYKPEDTDNRPTDCYSLYKQGKTGDGLYRIFLHGLNTNISVMCEMQTGGWTVLLQRNDGSIDFYRNFRQYKEGFGVPSSEHYIGNEVIHYFTNQKRYTLKVTLTNWEGETTFALYDHFWIDSEDSGFRLHLQGFSGTAGDGLGKHSGMKFSTHDVDNDLLKTEMGGSCAKRFKGAGWYYKCYMSNLMGVYYNNAVIPEKQFDGITWKPWLGPSYSMKKVVMSVRPLNRE